MTDHKRFVYLWFTQSKKEIGPDGTRIEQVAVLWGWHPRKVSMHPLCSARRGMEKSGWTPRGSGDA